MTDAVCRQFDGGGFDTEAAPTEDGDTHLGIPNYRARLAGMVKGTLEIESMPGVGTITTITIPKEDD